LVQGKLHHFIKSNTRLIKTSFETLHSGYDFVSKFQSSYKIKSTHFLYQRLNFDYLNWAFLYYNTTRNLYMHGIILPFTNIYEIDSRSQCFQIFI
jgi:hypothetical protein